MLESHLASINASNASVFTEKWTRTVDRYEYIYSEGIDSYDGRQIAMWFRQYIDSLKKN